MSSYNQELAEYVAKTFEATLVTQEVILKHLEITKPSEADRTLFMTLLHLLHSRDEAIQALAEQNMDIYDRIEKFLKSSNEPTRKNPSV